MDGKFRGHTPPSLGELRPSDSSGGSCVLGLSHQVLDASVLKRYASGHEDRGAPSPLLRVYQALAGDQT